MQRTKIVFEIVGILLLIVLNIRGVKESVTSIVPVFAMFVVTHIILLVVAIGGHAGEIGHVTGEVSQNLHHTVGALGAFGALALLPFAPYSLGGGTYTGIEAVSNGVPIMREPKVRTASRTMVLMATSLSITAGGIILAYRLVRVRPDFNDPTKPMNAILLDKVAGAWHLGDFHAGYWFVLCALFSEAGLLFVAAQAGFVDGPRVMANMAVDSWLPHRFAALSERLSMQNGVVLMGCTSIAALIYTHGDVEKLVVMYSINVFLTFSLSNLGMARFWIQNRKEHKDWFKHLPVHIIGLTLCVTILIVTSVVKFAVGGWLTLLVTGLLVFLCFGIKRHYGRVVSAIRQLDTELPDPLEELATVPKPSVASLHQGTSSQETRTARPLEAHRGHLRGRLRRPRAARAPDVAPHVPGPLQGRRLLFGRRDRLGRLQGHRRSARARTAHADGAQQVRPVRRLARPARREHLRHWHRGRRRSREDRDGARPQIPQGALRRRPAHLRRRHLRHASPAQRDGLHDPAAATCSTPESR